MSRNNPSFHFCAFAQPACESLEVPGFCYTELHRWGNQDLLEGCLTVCWPSRGDEHLATLYWVSAWPLMVGRRAYHAGPADNESPWSRRYWHTIQHSCCAARRLIQVCSDRSACYQDLERHKLDHVLVHLRCRPLPWGSLEWVAQYDPRRKDLYCFGVMHMVTWGRSWSNIWRH